MWRPNEKSNKPGRWSASCGRWTALWQLFWRPLNHFNLQNYASNAAHVMFTVYLSAIVFNFSLLLSWCIFYLQKKRNRLSTFLISRQNGRYVKVFDQIQYRDLPMTQKINNYIYMYNYSVRITTYSDTVRDFFCLGIYINIFCFAPVILCFDSLNRRALLVCYRGTSWSEGKWSSMR